MGDGHSVNVIGLKLCPPEGCDRRRDVGAQVCFATIEVRKACFKDQCDIDDNKAVQATQERLCGNTTCRVIKSGISDIDEIIDDTKTVNDDNSATSQTVFLYLIITAIFLVLN